MPMRIFRVGAEPEKLATPPKAVLGIEPTTFQLRKLIRLYFLILEVHRGNHQPANRLLRRVPAGPWCGSGAALWSDDGALRRQGT